jgi:hypothetical protein
LHKFAIPSLKTKKPKIKEGGFGFKPPDLGCTRVPFYKEFKTLSIDGNKLTTIRWVSPDIRGGTTT